MTGPRDAGEARAERDRILDEVTVAHCDAIAAGMQILQRMAATGRPFSANDCRDQLRQCGLAAASTGALFNAALKAKLIRRIGYETSTDIGTHHKPIARYIGGQQRTPLEALVVPVQRDPAGRFATPASSDQDALFEVAAG